MRSVMKTLNNISRSQTEFRRARLHADVSPAYYAVILTVNSHPGFTQDAIAKEICVNKSTVARRLDWLEDNGYVTREVGSEDRRCLFVYPTDKCKEIVDKLKVIAKEWNAVLTDGISDEEYEVFKSVLSRMEERAKSLIKENLK